MHDSSILKPANENHDDKMFLSNFSGSMSFFLLLHVFLSSSPLKRGACLLYPPPPLLYPPWWLSHGHCFMKPFSPRSQWLPHCQSHGLNFSHFISWPLSSIRSLSTFQFLKDSIQGFPGGAVVENLPANAGDTGSSPGLGRSHMPRSN